MLERIAHAKINLSLHITGLREDGYHLLDSLVVFTQFGDIISIKEKPDASSLVSLKIDGPFSAELEEGANNLVSRAALALGYKVTEQSGKPTPIEISLTKNLPIASGIGGGSADAAATLIALKEFWQCDVALEPIAIELGADTPMCLHSKPLRAQGIGEEITQLTMKAPLHLVMINPLVEVPTPAIFKKLKNKNNQPIPQEIFNNLEDIKNIQVLRNDLQEPAIEVEPVIASVLSLLENTQVSLVRMSGSGATCFGLYERQELAEQAVDQIKQVHPDWWCIASATTVS